MTLKWKLSLRLCAALIPVMAVWAALFYFIMAEEIRDEVDDSLLRYSRVVVPRFLYDEDPVDISDGYNNVYTITQISREEALGRKYISFKDTTISLGSGYREDEPARKLSLVFSDSEGQYHLLEAMTPTFERDDLMETVLKWVVILYLVLTVTIGAVTIFIVQTGLRPMYMLLSWLRGYRPGEKGDPVPTGGSGSEFNLVSQAVQDATDRSERLLEQQKEFIGNAAHELQTPLAVLGSSLELMMNDADATEAQMAQIHDMLGVQRRASRLTRTLLTIAKIDSGQALESGMVNMSELVREQVDLYREVYEDKGLSIDAQTANELTVRINEPLAGMVVSNLIKNACAYSRPGGRVNVSVQGSIVMVENEGAAALDAENLFQRFRQGGGKESNGLGLALVKSVCDRYGVRLDYIFKDGMHRFSADFSEIAI